MRKLWRLWNMEDEFRTLHARMEILLERVRQLEEEIDRLRKEWK